MSDDYVTFDAVIEPMEWGRNTYTILRLPDDVLDALGPTRRVEGEFNDHPVNLAITRAPVIEGAFLWAGKALLRRVDVTPGEPFEARLRPAPDDAVEVAEDLQAALRAADRTAAWEALTPGKQRGLLHGIDTAKRAETRAKRIAKLVAGL